MHAWIRAAALLVMLSASCACSAESASGRLPPGAKTILDNAAQLELLSLDPSFRENTAPREKQFHSWPVLGSTQLTGKSKQHAISTIEQGISAKNDVMALCFNPRHGIRATYQGKTVELVICFECIRMQLEMGSESTSLPLTGRGQAELDALLTAAKVPLPPKR